MLAASAKCRLGGHTWRYVDYPRIYESCTHHYLNLLHKRLGGHTHGVTLIIRDFILHKMSPWHRRLTLWIYMSMKTASPGGLLEVACRE